MTDKSKHTTDNSPDLKASFNLYISLKMILSSSYNENDKIVDRQIIEIVFCCYKISSMIFHYRKKTKNFSFQFARNKKAR